jgi:UDP-N-acetylglucosamine--N-acetylmuramyl-(pentapeptide) pyrophosphoryl-undecaprenol N-acetylglucosamine transferase
MKRILITGGGTGGHIFPSIAIAHRLQEKLGDDARLIYIGSGNSLEQPLYDLCDVSYTITSGKWNRFFTWKNLIMPFLVLWGFFQSLIFLLREMPDVVFSKGGSVSFPVVLAARLYAIPVVLHESDVIPGMSHRILGKFAQKIALGFDDAGEYFLKDKVVSVGNIAREDISLGDAKRGRERFGLSESKPIIVVLGGSQGAKNINEHVVDILEEILPLTQVLHQTGKEKLEETKARARKHEGVKPGRRGYVPVGFFDAEEMRDALACADVVISRSGATAIAEIAACHKVALLIPLESSANNHQRMNAFVLAKQGAALVLEEGNLHEHMLVGKIKKLLFETELREAMKKNIAQFSFPEAADRVADIVLGEIKQ